MTEKQFLNTEKSRAAEKTGGKFEKNKPEKELVKLLESKNLSREKVIETARTMSMSVLILCHRIFTREQKADEFIIDKYIDYARQIGEELSKEEVALSFLEKIQQKPEPARIKQKPQVVDVPKAPVAPIISPEKESQPVIAPSQVLKTPIPEPVSPAKSIEYFPQPKERNWWEVKRETEVMAVEDLDGDIRTFEKHVTKLGAAKKDASGQWKWTGGNKKLVFLGDVLGDRKMDGIQITSIIRDLADQAKKENGQVDHLCGNHDIDFIKFLSKSMRDNWAKINAQHFTNQNIGIWEMAQFDPDHDSELRIIKTMISSSAKKEFERRQEELWDKLYKRTPEILANMRAAVEGRKILENICRIKVAVVHDDTLYCHTDPTHRMMADLANDGNIAQRIANVNQTFQENLRGILFESARFDDNFKRICDIYLYADNREYFTEQKSFEVLAENALIQVMEYLYESKQVKFVSDAEEWIQKKGFKNLEWGDWWYLLSNDLRSAKIRVGEDALEKWKKENGIGGDYIDEIGEILSKVIALREIEVGAERAAKADEVRDLEKMMAEKIKKSNPTEDIIKKVRNSGINAIIHGHSPRHDERYFNKDGLVIVSPHATFYDQTNYENFEKGTSVIKTNGEIDSMGKIFRGNRV